VKRGGPPGEFANQEVLCISEPQFENENEDNEGDEGAESSSGEEDGQKMSRAEWLMAQVDLDPIESHGSMEMSTTKFKSAIGGKRFM